MVPLCRRWPLGQAVCSETTEKNPQATSQSERLEFLENRLATGVRTFSEIRRKIDDPVWRWRKLHPTSFNDKF